MGQHFQNSATTPAQDPMGVTPSKAPRTVNYARSALVGFSRWLHVQGRLPTDPLLSLPRQNEAVGRRVTRRALSDPELAWLFNAAKTPVVRVTKRKRNSQKEL